MKKVISYFVYAVFLTILFYCAIVYRSDIAGGVSFGIDYSLSQLIPSLFPMIFLSCFISFSPVSDLISYAFSFFTRKVLKVPSLLAPTIIFGLCCGYPVGARLCANLLEQKKIDKKTAQDCLMYVVNPGIPFAVLFVGAGIFGSLKLGFYLFLSTALASLSTAILISINKKALPKESFRQSSFSFLECFNLSAKSSLSATVTMCLYIIIFSAFLPLLHSLGIMENISDFILRFNVLSEGEINTLVSFFAEVVHGVTTASSTNAKPFIYLIGLAFGGVCIHFQVLSLFETSSSLVCKFFIGRILNIVFSYLYFNLLLKISPIAVSTFSNFNSFSVETSKASSLGSICLILLSISFIYCNIFVEKNKKM